VLSDATKSKLSISEIVLKGTIIAAIITIPSIMAFLLSWFILEDFMVAVILGGIIHFIAMGFGLKISKKILIKK
jgi:hypothetical protein|tara:strand:+ start:682 stop:903 length:222 start_codon:yes stop_codon:yes gene_type:complete